MRETRKVIVVGAGPVGLTVAMRLGSMNIPCVVYEAEREPQIDLRASTFHPPTLDMLDRYDLAAPLIAQGLISRQWQVRIHESEERVVFDLGVLAGDTGHPYRLQCEQARLVALLLDRLKAIPEVSVRRGLRVDALTQTADTVSIEARDADGRPERDTGRLLVAADGARSFARDALHLALRGETYPETTILATTRFAFEDHLPGLSNVNYVWTKAGTYSLLRLPDLWRCSLYPDAGETIEQATDPESVERKLQRIVPRHERYEVIQIRPYRVHRRIVDDFRCGRVLLAGDAAHINSPSGGMGMNGGIHDAFALTGCIAAMWTTDDLDLLDRYNRTRRPIAADDILGQADENRKRMQERDPARRRAAFERLQAIVADPVLLHAHLLRSSMISGLRRAETLA
jgi:2-polyprenyl-6-methoxyphenol hydroxylase-like FAD-dependent oxidoreductase